MIATGLIVPQDTVWLLWRLNVNAGALWIYAPAIADAPVAEDGDSISADQRAVLPESAGQSIGGAPYARFTAGRELLVATSGANEDLAFDLLRYVPADQTPGGGGTALTGAEIKALYEAQADTNAFTDARLAKLAAIAAGANNIVPYKLGNIYIATAGTVPAKPANTEGIVTAAGITAAPAGWRLTRPEATAALSWVYDCHVYGYVTNLVFGVQYGTPNRTDRYVAPGSFDLHDDVPDEVGGVSSSDRLLISDESIADDPNRYVTVTNLRTALVTAATVRSRLALSEAEVASMLVNAVVAGDTLTLTMNDGSTVDFVRVAAGAGIDAAAANALIQAALAAAVTGNTESGIDVTHNADGTLDFVVTGGGGTPAPTDDIYFGTSADDEPESGELDIPAVNGVGTIPLYAGSRHHLIARLATEDDIVSVLYSDDPTQTNNVHAFSASTARPWCRLAKAWRSRCGCPTRRSPTPPT